ncbi:MAG: SDR family NAD(P)-dependent oxidoreductase [Deltaproteobacteria bacterium]|nr:SDR family NAD(P)-dependent oxidoreductase [Deltaproteobacteria bacterium]
MKALVTGGHGFIGSFLVEKLLKEKISVRCLIRKTSNLQWIKNLPIDLVYGDITQPETLPAAVKDIDIIYHVAGAIKGSTREKFFSVNCDGTLLLAQAAQKTVPHLKRFIFVSSVAAAGPVEGTQKPTENSDCHPVSDYGKSKLEAEHRLKEKFPTLPLTIIRPPIVYGPRDSNFLTFFKFAKRGIFLVPPPYERYFSIVYVKDLVEGIYVASQAEAARGQTYFMANPEFYSFESLASHLSRPFSKTPHFIYVPALLVRLLAWAGDAYVYITKKEIMLTSKKFPELAASSWICSSEKADRELHFKPQVPLSIGVRETVDWLREHRYL